MPSKSIAQQHLFQAAEHGADFPMANKVRESMSHDQMHDFAVGSEANKPQHVAVKGSTPDVLASNTNTFKNQGMDERGAVMAAIQAAQSQQPKPPRHKNLGKFLHPRKDGKPHGSE